MQLLCRCNPPAFRVRSITRLFRVGFVGACALPVAACGSSGTPSTSSSTTAGLATQALAYSRCMRSHGVTSFPDPSSGGGVSYDGSTHSPAFLSAPTASASLEPRKIVPSSGPVSTQEAARDHDKLLRWANCMRRRGYPDLPDPKIGTPQPTPGYGTVLGAGAAYVQIPDAYNAHSGAFLST